jgi:hypothetical protein
MTDEALTLKIEQGDYRMVLSPRGFTLTRLVSFDQRDERNQERCIHVPLEDMPALADLLDRFRARAIELGMAA